MEEKFNKEPKYIYIIYNDSSLLLDNSLYLYDKLITLILKIQYFTDFHKHGSICAHINIWYEEESIHSCQFQSFCDICSSAHSHIHPFFTEDIEVFAI